MLRRHSLAVAVISSLSLAAAAASAQQWTTSTDDSWCRDDHRWRDEKERRCEVREASLPATGSLVVDAGANGGIRVEGADIDEVRVRVRVETWEGTAPDEVVIQSSNGGLETAGPRRGHWSASFRIEVPRSYDLDLQANNGGLRVEGVDGQVRLETTNGGISLASMSGDVQGRTANGGLSVDLDGDTWRGEGLDVQTSNGGIDLSVPDGYSAELVTGTVNGRMHVDFPVTVQGELRKELRATLGDGGPTVRVKTTNGSVKVTRAG
jgi:DUF4097 and DUF4098 domain-containing protein YvlB